jgi:rhodanese-related sulfurtransferase
MLSQRLLLAGSLLLCGCGAKALPNAHALTFARPSANHLLKEAPIKVASPADAYKALLANSHITLIDVRQPEEFYAGHATPAVLHPLPELATWAAGLDKTASYMLICHSGNRSAKAATALVGLGFSDITNVAGGTAAWEAAGLPISQ